MDLLDEDTDDDTVVQSGATDWGPSMLQNRWHPLVTWSRWHPSRQGTAGNEVHRMGNRIT